LAQEERVIVSEVAGTTRDSVDVRFERDGQAFLAIDTAGLRKKGSLANDIEFYSLHRAQRSIRRADVVMQLFDPRDTISKVDKQLADYILENHKPAIFVVNKWDLAKDKIHTGKWADYLHKLFPALDYVPIVFITAKTSKNVWALLNLAQSIFKQANARVGTSELNRVLEMAMERRSPPVRLNKSPRIYFGTQVSTNPPTIVLKTNGPELFPDTYIRYLLGVFREQLPFKEVPIKLHLRDKTGSMKESESSEPEAIEASAPPKTKPKVKAKTSQQPAKGTRADVWRDV
jgi:GTP-binding protein